MASDSKMPDPKRFEVAKATLLVDGFMTQFIKVGGIGIIAAVFGIFVFILVKIFPLFQGAEVEPETVVETGVTDVRLLGVDEWGELPFVADGNGALHFVDLIRKKPEGREQDKVAPELVVDAKGKPVLGPLGKFTEHPEALHGKKISSVEYHQKNNGSLIGYGTEDGKFILVTVQYTNNSQGEDANVTVELKTDKPLDMGESGKRLDKVAFYDNSEEGLRTVAVIQDGAKLLVERFKAKVTLLGKGALKPEDSFDLTSQLDGKPLNLLVSAYGDGILVATEGGVVNYFRYHNEDYELSQSFKPFEGRAISSMNWLFGQASMVLTSEAGDNVVFSSFRDEEANRLQYKQIKNFDRLIGGGSYYNHSLRNRSFLIGSGKQVSLRHQTTESIRWEDTLDFEPVQGILGPKYDRILLANEEGGIHILKLKDPHPEAGWNAYFGKIWYEGQPEPAYSWQSTGGSASFEPKLSMMNLIFGTFKGTLYAMLFAVPIAVLAACYTSQFLRPEVKKIVKPTMEIMASLPSVVLGFLAALWLAPMIEARVPSILCCLVLIPLSAWLIGWGWGYLPQKTRMLIKPGYEFLVYIPAVILVMMLGWYIGPVIESMFFTIVDPATGETIADFRRWWPEATGTSFEQRNSMIIGFMMGFAVIPIIFTISEDAMTNVPSYLTSASLALGASRWQTAWRIVLPTASPGVFSALMIGLGRAVGETMIVVMATGNTAIMEWNVFNGMRTLSANIAVELPEAPQDGTLYRTLFLGAMILFVLTFAVNSIAEVTRQRLREKYKSV